MDRAARPWTFEIGQDATSIEQVSDLGFGPAALDEEVIDLSNNLNLVIGTGDKDDPVGCDALVLAAAERALRFAGLIDKHTSKAEACGAALAIAETDQISLAGEHLHGQLTAIFAGHRAFNGLDDR